MSISIAATLSKFDLAAANVLLAARSSFRGSGISWVVIGALAVVVIVALWMLSRWWLGQGSAGSRNSPKALFAELCRVHALAAGERQLLLALAESNRLVQPSELFVDPTYFDEQRLPTSLAARKGELKSLAGRLFAGLTPANDALESEDMPSDGSPPATTNQNPSPALN
jgi:hypothetical protein